MSRSIVQVFEEYQKARVQFVQTVADLSSRPQNIETLHSAGTHLEQPGRCVMSLLRPLLLDNVPSIQQTAALALGRLASHSEELAEAVVTQEILPQLAHSVAQQNRFYKRSAAFVIRAVSKHSAELAQVMIWFNKNLIVAGVSTPHGHAQMCDSPLCRLFLHECCMLGYDGSCLCTQAVVDSGALEALTTCLEEFDPQVKESAAWAMGYIARHSESLAQAVVDSGAVPLLVLCFQEPELPLKRISASALSDIAKHSPELAQAVCDIGAVPLLAKEISHVDAALKRQVCACLGKIATHSVDLAEIVVEAEIFPKILHCLKDPDEVVRKNAATCIREIVRHTQDLAKFVVNAGGVAALIDNITDARGNNRLPGIMALGYIAAFSETLALAIIVSKGIPPLKQALVEEPEDHLKAAAAWTLGQIGRHTPDHAMAVAEADVLRKLLRIHLDPKASDDLQTKTKRALKSILQKCTHLAALEPLLNEAPPPILKYVVQQYAKVLPNDVQGRRSFVQSGGLEQLLRIRNSEAGSSIADYVEEITELYPREIVNYYSPGYSEGRTTAPFHCVLISP
ncbi:putative sperm associated antigen 6 [Toxoplasma gondii]|uniref:Putative sperm associated antigen 6 n=1 Tax=Toxoplasma gondii TaxID=5811 RepID=A0A7J6KFN7_TOXGO|nr:putative sperm associated antigen 6 [Toxoplasma gondii]